MAAPEENLVSLKVMRLCRPSFVQQQPVPLPREASSSAADAACALSGSLSLPQSFGDIFLGETFSCYISLANVSHDELTQTGLKVEVQTQVQRETLSDSGAPLADGGAAPRLDALQHGQTLDRTIQYELKDVGIHILICSATFSVRKGVQKSFRKFFKLQVHSPNTSLRTPIRPSWDVHTHAFERALVKQRARVLDPHPPTPG